jgi:hypothetical protein
VSKLLLLCLIPYCPFFYVLLIIQIYTQHNVFFIEEIILSYITYIHHRLLSWDGTGILITQVAVLNSCDPELWAIPLPLVAMSCYSCYRHVMSHEWRKTWIEELNRWIIALCDQNYLFNEEHIMLSIYLYDKQNIKEWAIWKSLTLPVVLLRFLYHPRKVNGDVYMWYRGIEVMYICDIGV